jgi:hypothetical protein
MDDEMGGECGTNGEKTNIQSFDVETRNTKAVFTDLVIDGRQYQYGSQGNSLGGRELDESGSK